MIEITATRTRISDMRERAATLFRVFEYEDKKERLEEVMRELEQPDVWNQPERAQALGKERASLELVVQTLEKVRQGLDDVEGLVEAAGALIGEDRLGRLAGDSFGLLLRQVRDGLVRQLDASMAEEDLGIGFTHYIGLKVLSHMAPCTANELAQAIESVASRNRMTQEQLRARLVQDGLSYEEFRDSLRDEMLVERLRQRYLQSRVQVSEAEIDQLLAVREIGGPEVRLANIIVAVPDGATAEDLATAQKKARDIKSVVERGEIDFAAAAIRFSDAPNALEGGNIGWRALDAIPPAFVGLIQQMQPGQISEPVRGPSGYQLIQLVETREQGRQTLTEYNAQGIMIRVTPTLPAEAARQKAEDLYARMAAIGRAHRHLLHRVGQERGDVARGAPIWRSSAGWSFSQAAR